MRVTARANLPTRYGTFEIVAFVRLSGEALDHVALMRGSLQGSERVPVRVHSECLTGDVMGSFRCDCRDQLEMALRELSQAPKAALLYLRQEGRGIGLSNKIKAYEVQQQRGLDTVEANRHLGFDDDLRDYTDAALMLQCLGVRSVELLTNNPHKIADLQRNGIEVARRIPLRPPDNEHNREYIRVKQRKLGHL